MIIEYIASAKSNFPKLSIDDQPSVNAKKTNPNKEKNIKMFAMPVMLWKHKYKYKKDFILISSLTDTVYIKNRKENTMAKQLAYNEIIELINGAQYKKDVRGWETLRNFDNNSLNNAFDYKVYKQGNKIVLSLSGTNILNNNDLRNDIAIWRGKIPSQYGDAERLYNNIKQKYPKADIETVGYSLGGSVANLLSHRTGIPSYAVEPIGSQHIVDKNKDYFKYDGSNITTYGRNGDFLYNINKNKQSGNVKTMQDLPSKNPLNFAMNHILDTITPQNLFRAKPKGQLTGPAVPIDFDHVFTPSEIGSMSDEDFERNEHTILQQAAQGLIQPQSNLRMDFNGWKNPISGDNKIFTREMISEMSDDEYSENEKAIHSQLNSIGIPTNSELSTSTGTVYVKSYVRSDGTQVKGYYRSR